jgi:cell wall-associated NlpC family hydrolase
MFGEGIDRDSSQVTGNSGIDSATKNSGLDKMDVTGTLDGLLMPTVDEDQFRQAFPDGSSNFALTSTTGGGRAAVENYAKQFLGTPYVWGGTSPSGFDCSGFTQFVWKKFGLGIPRLTYGQAGAGATTKNLNQLRPMDLVLFNNGDSQGPGHVAFWLGNGMILEAPYTGAKVRIRKIGAHENVFGVQLKYGGK